MPRLGEIHALLALGRARDAEPLADELATRVPRDADVLAARARVRLAVGDAAGALESVKKAQTLAPGRADLFHLAGPGLGPARRPAAALDAFNAALQLDSIPGARLVRAGRAGGGAAQLGGGPVGLRARARSAAHLRHRCTGAGRSYPAD